MRLAALFVLFALPALTAATLCAAGAGAEQQPKCPLPAAPYAAAALRRAQAAACDSGYWQCGTGSCAGCCENSCKTCTCSTCKSCSSSASSTDSGGIGASIGGAVAGIVIAVLVRWYLWRMCCRPAPVQPAADQAHMQHMHYPQQQQCVGHFGGFPAARPTFSRPPYFFPPHRIRLIYAQFVIPQFGPIGLGFGDGGLVTSVAPGGQAERAGIRAGTFLIAANGAAMGGQPAHAIVAALAASPRPLALLVGQPVLPVQPLPQAAYAPQQPPPAAFQAVIPKDGPIGLGLGDGGYVTGVAPGSQAELAGIRVGSLLVAINGAGVGGLPVERIGAALAAAPRPLTLSFAVAPQ